MHAYLLIQALATVMGHVWVYTLAWDVTSQPKCIFYVHSLKTIS